jgi:hypothetical protein
MKAFWKAVLRIRDVYPWSWFLPIPDPKIATKERGGKQICCHTFYVATNFTKLKIIFVLKCWRKKIWANFQRIIELFTQKIVTKISKIWVWDPGSEIRDTENNYSGSRNQGSKRHRIPDPQHCWKAYLSLPSSDMRLSLSSSVGWIWP